MEAALSKGGFWGLAVPVRYDKVSVQARWSVKSNNAAHISHQSPEMTT